MDTHAHPDRRGLARSMLAIAVLPSLALPSLALAQDAALDGAAEAALGQLYATNTKARELGDRSQAILIFPKVTKAGLMIGGMRGDGVLKAKGQGNSYFTITAGSFGLQAGAQQFSYVLFFVTPSAVEFLTTSKGWQIGSGPSVVVLDEGMARTMTSTTLTQDVYAMIFGQKGLMGGLGLEGSKISKK